MRRILLLIALTTAVALMAGCRAERTFHSPYDIEDQPRTLERGTIAEVHALMRERAVDHPTLWSGGKIVISVQGERKKQWFDMTLLFRSPDAIRLRGSRIPIGTLFEVIMNGDSAWVYLNREKELYAGQRADLSKVSGVTGALSLQDMMAAILVNQDLLRRLDEGGRWTVLPTQKDVLLAKSIEDGRQLIWRLRRSDGLVREVVLRGPQDRIEMRVSYWDYALESDATEPLPEEFVIGLYEDQLNFDVEIDKYKINPALVDAVFLPPKAEKVFPMEMLSQRDAIETDE